MKENIKLLIRSFGESGFGRFLVGVSLANALVFIIPMPLIAKLIVLFIMNLFLFVASSVLYIVLVDKYLSKKLVVNFITLGLSTVSMSAFAVYAVSILSAVGQPAEVTHAALAQTITPYAIASTVFSNYLAWILVGVAHEAGSEGKMEGFDTLYKGVIITLVLLKVMFLFIAYVITHR